MKRVVYITLFALVLFTSLFTSSGQNSSVITVAVPTWMADTINDDTFVPFEEAHPGVNVVVVHASTDGVYTPPAYDLETHLDSTHDYFSSADILHISSSWLSPQTVQAGYVLDIGPLVESDGSFSADDFYPQALESFRWDRGLWAMPVSLSLQVIIYDYQAFDEAGLAYPNENWTLDDLIYAAELLTTYDADGNVEVPGFNGYNIGPLFIAAIGDNFYDETVLPTMPDFSNPSLATMLENWAAFNRGIQVQQFSQDVFDSIPIQISETWRLTNTFDSSFEKWRGALLPGGVAGLNVEGFAVSAGTLNPELAYELAKWLTEDVSVTTRFFGDLPARRSLIGVEDEDSNFIMPSVPEEVQAFRELAVAQAIPASEARFSNFINLAMNRISNGESSVDVLAELQANAIDTMQQAAARRDEVQVAVATPVPTPVIGSDEIVLSFGVNVSELPNRDRWDDLVLSFVENTPGIGHIEIITPIFTSEDQEKVDCYYSGYNNIQAPGFQFDQILNLDPFLDADPDFDQVDFLGDSLAQAQANNMTWAFPMILQPEVLWYDSSMFADANVPEPIDGWTIDGFRDALIQLASQPDAAPPFDPQSFNPTYLTLLIAAHGTIPYDVRTDPPTLNLTDPTSVDAIQQTLDLAKNGLMNYREIELLGGGGGGGGNVPVVTDTLNGYSWRLTNRNDNEYYETLRLTNYPTGSQYQPVAYQLGVAFINAQAQDPAACYEWIKTVSNHPELFSGVPARRSVINDPIISTIFGEDVATLFTNYATLLDDPNTVNLSGTLAGDSASLGTWIEPVWLYNVYNAYVLEDADLESELIQAEENISIFRACTQEIPPIDIEALIDDQEASIAYFRQFTDCAIAITPELKEDSFSFYYQETD